MELLSSFTLRSFWRSSPCKGYGLLRNKSAAAAASAFLHCGRCSMH